MHRGPGGRVSFGDRDSNALMKSIQISSFVEKRSIRGKFEKEGEESVEGVYRESETGVKWHFSPLGEILFRYLFYFNDLLVNNSLSIRRWWEIGGGRWSKGRGGVEAEKMFTEPRYRRVLSERVHRATSTKRIFIKSPEDRSCPRGRGSEGGSKLHELLAEPLNGRRYPSSSPTPLGHPFPLLPSASRILGCQRC